MVYVGLDAGGSKTKLVARCPGAKDITLVGPAANLQTVGIERCAVILTDLVEQALRKYPEARLAAACAGLAGAGREEDKLALIEAWRERLGSHAPNHLLVTHDGEIAVEAAFQGGSGVIVIVGTGSVAIAKDTDGRLHRVGGWGYLLGDEGSGLITGLSGLRAVAHAMDGGPATLLQSLLASHFDIRTPGDLIHNVYQEKWRAQQFAADVVEAAQQGDAIAAGILDEQLHALALQVTWLVGACGAVEPRVALLGGLTNLPHFKATLTEKLEEVLPGWVVEKSAHDPAFGALRLAMSAAGALQATSSLPETT